VFIVVFPLIFVRPRLGVKWKRQRGIWNKSDLFIWICESGADKAKITTFNERMMASSVHSLQSLMKHKISPVHQWGLYYGETCVVVLSLFVCERGVGQEDGVGQEYLKLKT